jgi:signal transduction histidine kinase
MGYFSYYSRKITLIFILFSAFLSGLCSVLIWVSIESTDDQVRKDLLKAQGQRLIRNFEKTGRIYQKDELVGIKILLENRDNIPFKWRALTAGIHEDSNGMTHINKIVLPVDNTSRQILLIHVPLYGDVLDNNEFPIQLLLALISLLVTSIGSLIGVMLARNLAAPVRELSLKISNTDPKNPEFEPLNRNDEFGEISAVFAKTLRKINQVIEREKQFSAYVSHELRTPVAVIKSSLELSKACREQEDSIAAKRIEEQALSRMAIANGQMELLIKTFLYLGKNNCSSEIDSCIDIVSILSAKIEFFQQEHQLKKIDICQQFTQTSVTCNDKILDLIIDNLLRNTFSYCAGSITFTLKNHELCIYNDIDQLRIDTAEHFGFGLSIVNDLCNSQHWVFSSGKIKSGRYKSSIRFCPALA